MFSRAVTFFVLALTCAFAGAADPQKDPSLLVVFAAKGAWIGFDVGAIGVATQHLEPLRKGDVVITGASSGSLLAAIYSCYGFGDEAQQRGMNLLKNFDKSKALSTAKFWPVVEGKETANPRENLIPIVDGMFTSPCTANLPVAITAGNMEVNDNRLKVGDRVVPMVGGLKKQLNPDTMAVYQRGMLNDRNGYVGRGCTYFVNQKMFDYLLRIPEDERQCDLRLMRNQEDLKAAIYASSAEPTYFFPWQEPHPELVRLTDQPGVELASRTYNGGYAMTNPVQDVKRAFPHIFAFSTGRAFFSGGTQFFVHHQFLVPNNDQIKRQRWFVDAEIPYSESEWNAKPNKGGFPVQDAIADLQIGIDRANACFSGQNCIPVETLKPYFTWAYDGQPLERLVGRGLGFWEHGENFTALRNTKGQPLTMRYEEAARACGKAGGGMLSGSKQLPAARMQQIFGGAAGCVWTDRLAYDWRRTLDARYGVFTAHKPTDKCFVLCQK